MGKSGKQWEEGTGKGNLGESMLFRGNSYRSLDPKGRIMLPASFRDTLLQRAPDGLCVLTTYDGCIFGYAGPDWADFEEKIARLGSANREIRNFRRLILGGAEEQQPDPQGRIRLSRSQMDYAGITREVVVLGQGRHFEIWDQDAYRALQEQDYGDVADLLAEKGIDLPL